MPDDRPRTVNWLSAVALVVAVAALALAGWAFARTPTTAAEPDYSQTQRDDAKTAVCEAFASVRTGVATNTNLQPPGGSSDITGALAVAANARVSLYDGGQYLLARLDPATPTDLADAVRKFANGLQDIGAAATAGVPNTDPVQAQRLRDADAASRTIAGLCK